MKIIVIDDDSIVVGTFCSMLQALGANARGAHVWSDVVNAIAQGFHPDVVLTDLSMPDVDGYEVLNRIKEMKLSRKPRIIAVSGNTDDKTRKLVTTVGFDGFLGKPVTLRMLTAILSGAHSFYWQ